MIKIYNIQKMVIRFIFFKTKLSNRFIILMLINIKIEYIVYHLKYLILDIKIKVKII